MFGLYFSFNRTYSNAYKELALPEWSSIEMHLVTRKSKLPVWTSLRCEQVWKTFADKNNLEIEKLLEFTAGHCLL